MVRAALDEEKTFHDGTLIKIYDLAIYNLRFDTYDLRCGDPRFTIDK